VDITTAVTLTINSLPPLVLDVPTTPHRYILLVPPDLDGESTLPHSGIVRIQSETFYPARASDRRDLGIAVFAAQWGTLTPQP
jgi:hypothetical protein